MRKNIKISFLLLIFVGISALIFSLILKEKNKQDVLITNSVYSKQLNLTSVSNGVKKDIQKNFYKYVNEKTSSVENISAELKSQSLQPKIIDRFLPLSNSEARSKTDDITHIVIHFSSNVIAKPNDPYIPEDVINIFKQYGVSAHYLISRDGTIFRLVDESRIAYHAGKGNLPDYPQYKDKLNRHSIGIEILAIGTEEEMKQYISSEIYRSIPKNYIGYTEKQYMALNLLLQEIYKRHDIKIDRHHVIGHDEYSVGIKKDPGSLFDWSKIGF